MEHPGLEQSGWGFPVYTYLGTQGDLGLRTMSCPSEDLRCLSDGASERSEWLIDGGTKYGGMRNCRCVRIAERTVCQPWRNYREVELLD